MSTCGKGRHAVWGSHRTLVIHSGPRTYSVIDRGKRTVARFNKLSLITATIAPAAGLRPHTKLRHQKPHNRNRFQRFVVERVDWFEETEW